MVHVAFLFLCFLRLAEAWSFAATVTIVFAARD
jgi:hypothetical protein